MFSNSHRHSRPPWNINRFCGRTIGNGFFDWNWSVPRYLLFMRHTVVCSDAGLQVIDWANCDFDAENNNQQSIHLNLSSYHHLYLMLCARRRRYVFIIMRGIHPFGRFHCHSALVQSHIQRQLGVFTADRRCHNQFRIIYKSVSSEGALFKSLPVPLPQLLDLLSISWSVRRIRRKRPIPFRMLQLVHAADTPESDMNHRHLDVASLLISDPFQWRIPARTSKTFQSIANSCQYLKQMKRTARFSILSVLGFAHAKIK